jgi:hypothetical protein
MFFTIGTRLDQSSAFGDAFNVEAYPKAGFSWVVSEEPFWGSSWLDHLRLRAAWGTSGLQPGAYDALRTWRAVTGGENQAGVRPQSVGNENLKPERSTEREIGAELGMFGDRLTLDVTGYYQTTQDAILQRRLPASTGFLSPQFVNIGELTSRGLESTVTAQIVQGSDLQFSINGTFSLRSSEVSDLADVAEYRVSYNANRWNWVKEGYEPAAVIGPTIDPNDPYTLGVPIEEFDDLTQLSPNTLKTAAGSDSMVFHGHNLPTKTITLSPTLDLPDDNLTIRMMWKAETGFVMFDQTNQIRANTGITPRVAGWTQELKNPNTSTERRRQIADAWANIHPNIQTLWVQDADYLKLQELSVAWGLPSGFLDATGLDTGRLTFSGRHLLLFTKYGGMTDPGTTNTRAQAADLIQNVDYYSAPIPPRVGVELNLGF